MKKNHSHRTKRFSLLSATAGILSLALILVAAFSCNKNNSNSNTCKTDVASISGTYKPTKYYYRTSPTAAEVDYTNIALGSACEKDNVVVLGSNGTYQLVDAGVVCSPPSTKNGTWSLSGNTMTINGVLNNIESFDCATLVVSSNDVNQPGDRLRVVFTKQ